MVKVACKRKSANGMHFLESLVGHMVHVSTVCPLAKAFLHHLFTLKATLKPGQTRHLNLSAQTNLAWWDALIESWPGISVQQFLMLRQPDYLIPCDASETWGCGPWCTPHWLQVPWSLPSPTLNSPAGAVPSCDSSCCMGGRLDRPPCPLPFRQCPSSRPGQQATCP